MTGLGWIAALVVLILLVTAIVALALVGAGAMATLHTGMMGLLLSQSAQQQGECV